MDNKMTPMMSQYLETKEEYKDSILFYRLGDFYEMFFDDAILVSRELELTLTGKSCGLPEKAPMCGVPFHSANVYVAKLIEKGYKVAICEQVEDPRLAKGLVKREVVRVITPGTIVDSELLSERDNNYLAAVYCGGGTYGITFSDISTGEIYATCVSEGMHVVNEMARYIPAEIIVNDECEASVLSEIELRIKRKPSVLIDEFFEFDNMDAMLEKQFPGEELDYNIVNAEVLKKSVCTALRYLESTQKSSFSYMNKLKLYKIGEFMDMDVAARRNLEITETMRDGGKKGSLLWVLDRTKTSMGARLMKQWLEKPLLSADMIRRRLDAVEELTGKIMLRDELSEALSGIYDISRITSRVSIGTVTPKDLISLRSSLAQLPEIKRIRGSLVSPMFRQLNDGLELMEDVREFLMYSIDDEAPALLRDGKVIKKGFDEELDKLNLAKERGGEWVRELEARERTETGIKNLRVSYNKVFGYYIEVSKSFIPNVPEHYIRKQTLANGERYITPELKSLEDTILGASEKIQALEFKIYGEIIEKMRGNSERLKKVCSVISVCDCLCSFSEAASKGNYVKPEITEDGRLEIRDGRHPVVEKMNRGCVFVPNDAKLDTDDNRMIIITGPNMAGKSTYMRQTALIVLMAQIGSFVPAAFARVGIVDKIFTRVGASDDIAAGQSTFMVEMSEVAHILDEATPKSLIILDEIGRGTSTYDGLSSAWSVVEYVQNKKKLGAKTLFATHYHELTQLEDKLDGVKNYNIAVKKRGESITFLRKIVPGGADESYGIEVAALAGVPDKVIKRAREILNSIEKNDGSGVKINVRGKKAEEPSAQLDFADTGSMELARELKNLDATTLTPIEAMNKLFELSVRAKEILD